MKIFYSLGCHILVLSVIVLIFLPLYLAFIAASHEGSALMQAPLPILPGNQLLYNLKVVLFHGLAAAGGEPLWRLLVNSFLVATFIAIGKICLALLSGFALVYFDLPFKKLIFMTIFSTMMLPIEVRIIPTFQVAVTLNILNSYTGLVLPLMASATGTFLFRQFFKTLPRELLDAAKLDGANSWRFFYDILLPISKTQIAALFVIFFVYGWNQYLWPLLITTDPKMATVVMGIKYLASVADQIPEWQNIMSIALIAMIPPCLLVLLLQKWFEKGLVH